MQWSCLQVKSVMALKPVILNFVTTEKFRYMKFLTLDTEDF